MAYRYNPTEYLRQDSFSSAGLSTHSDGTGLTAQTIFCSSGFRSPIFVESADGLDMTIPDPALSPSDIASLLGRDRTVDIMDCRTQEGEQCSLGQFIDYFNEPKHLRRRTLNFLSLEFSNSKLSALVSAPRVVREVDWIDLVWPKQLRDQQSCSTNEIHEMQFPKVQKYCLMSVSGCYTDFHIDMGGTSVWYHIMKGEKFFWLIPPTDDNMRAFYDWTTSGQQHLSFFGSFVSGTILVHLRAGNTMFIPSGYIHAVYTPEDSIVFGGNFQHSYDIETQLSVFEFELNTKVSSRLQLPYFLELQWYVVAKYVQVLTGKFVTLNDTHTQEYHNDSHTGNISLTRFEIDGLCCLYDWLSDRLTRSRRRSKSSKTLPNIFTKFSKQHRNLLEILKSELKHHSLNEHEQAVKLAPVLSRNFIVQNSCSLSNKSTDHSPAKKICTRTEDQLDYLKAEEDSCK